VPDCNIRNVDESLMREWKAKALQAGLTLRDWVIRTLTEASKPERKAERAGIAPFLRPPSESGPTKKLEKTRKVERTGGFMGLEVCRHGLVYCRECQGGEARA
jgi:hypothetical protein